MWEDKIVAIFHKEDHIVGVIVFLLFRKQTEQGYSLRKDRRSHVFLAVSAQSAFVLFFVFLCA